LPDLAETILEEAHHEPFGSPIDYENSLPYGGPYRREDRLTQGQALQSRSEFSKQGNMSRSAHR